MYTPDRTRISLVVLCSVILLAVISCSIFSTSPTFSVEDALATMTLMVWTPTAISTPTQPPTSTPTETPPPTETPLPSPTATPSYDWCKGMDTRSAKVDEVKVGGPKGDKVLPVFACLVEIVGVEKRSFPETALLVKLGFNDKDGVLHIYPAVIGGLIYTKSQPEEFKYPACFSKNPPEIYLDEYIESLKPYMGLEGDAKPFPALIYMEMGYERHSPSEASLVNRFAELHGLLDYAIKTGTDFPQPTERYRLFILPGLQPCQ